MWRKLVVNYVSDQSQRATLQQPGILTSLHKRAVQVKLNKVSKLVTHYTWAAVNTPGWTAQVKHMCGKQFSTCNVSPVYQYTHYAVDVLSHKM